ncbi:MAG: prepilin-type N-terminal cleavage/methylation domain-containing protein [Planctomycetota bacterium]|nr:MAG: prepilin-type N-terminal cleavage/methylation domain-containing protein [Planctomycetota bacterium]
MASERSGYVLFRAMTYGDYQRFGFTLTEMLVTVGMIGIIMVGMGSAILIAAKALPEDAEASSQLIHTGLIADDLVTELQNACHIVERTSNAITFTIADYYDDNDNSSERIRYAWSGTPGDPLTRQHNGGSEIPILENVQQFNLVYDLKSLTEQYPGLPVEGPEQILSSYTGAIDLKEYKVDDNLWCGQYFKPSAAVLTSDTLSWRVTRVLLMAIQNSPVKEYSFVQLRPADDNYSPTSTVLEEQIMYENNLPRSYAWTEFFFTNVAGLAPEDDLCLVVKHGGGGPSCRIIFENNNSNGATGMLKTTDAGANWNYEPAQSMLYYIWGTISAPGPDQIATRQYVTGIKLSLQAGDDYESQINTAIRMLNTPELLSAWWELDFHTSPTDLDMNGDGISDWVTGSGSFNPGTLFGDVWSADRAIYSNPANDFVELTTVEVEFRDITIGGFGAGVKLYVDSSDNTCGIIYATVGREDDGTQTLCLYTKPSAGTVKKLVMVTGLSSGFVNLRLLVDPNFNTVNIKINGEENGTYNYYRFATTNYHAIELTPVDYDTGAEFNYVSIRVGGTG